MRIQGGYIQENNQDIIDFRILKFYKLIYHTTVQMMGSLSFLWTDAHITKSSVEWTILFVFLNKHLATSH